jgi:DNA-binding NarL/FixJ family response regulator
MKVLIADNYSIVRTGVRGVLLEKYPDMVFEEVENEKSLSEKLLADKWSFIITNVILKENAGLLMLKQIKKTAPQIPVIVLCLYNGDSFALPSVTLGVSAFLGSKSTCDDIINAVENILKGKRYITEELKEQLLDLLDKDFEDLPHKKLSFKQLDILRLMARGESTIDISKKMSTTSNSINYHKSRIFTKMKMKSKTELIKYAVMQKLI